jgi:hypothetical protein
MIEVGASEAHEEGEGNQTRLVGLGTWATGRMYMKQRR